VDDEKFNCDIIEGFLMILGFEQRNNMTEYAYNGEQAVKKVKESIDLENPYKYSLILMDCNMPFLDGYEATKMIRKLYLASDITRDQQPKIVAITGHVEAEYI
jgi:CheY-like chemotaxis protein